MNGKKSIILSSLLIVFIVAGCGKKDVQSQRLDRAIAIDGSHEDWSNALAYEEGIPFSYGFFNDEDFLYGCMVTGDMNLKRQVVMRGLTLYVDAQNAKDKKIGIQYPVHSDLAGIMGMGGRNREEIPNMQEVLENRLERMSDECVLLGPEEDRSTPVHLNEIHPLDIKIGLIDNLLVYEFKIPLQDAWPTEAALGMESTQKLALGFEVPEFDRESMKAAMGGRPGGMGGGHGGMGGGMGGGRGGGGRGGMRGGPGGGSRPEIPTPVKQWISVQLAPENIDAGE